jgi:hypothetical protein
MSEWSHLPNAKHIDRILACLRDHPSIFHRQIRRNADTLELENGAFTAAWIAARDAQQPIRIKAWEEGSRRMRIGVETVAFDAIAALIAWDRAGDLLKLPVEQVKVLAILGDQPAILMYPAIAVMETIPIIDEELK